ncbi:NAD(P)-dependent oxidoreductase [Mesorhizobium sp. M1348]|uniref:NAD-dependent epimerase/dehydratase family protein n=1 Tax=Mesorhizobium sp. M1348 TaxID=2957089 RepID=UPI003336DEA7
MSQLRQQGMEIVTCDIRDMETVRAFVAGAQGAALIPMAGVIHPKTVAQFEAISTQGTINLLTAAQKVGVRRAIVTSSNSPIGCSPCPDHRFAEESPYTPTHGLWPRQDADGKGGASGNCRRQTCRNVHRPCAMALRSSRPSRRSSSRWSTTDKFLIVGSFRNRRSMRYTANLAHGDLLAATHKNAESKAFWPTDETPYTVNEIAETVGKVRRFDIMVKPAKSSITAKVATQIEASRQYVGIITRRKKGNSLLHHDGHGKCFALCLKNPHTRAWPIRRSVPAEGPSNFAAAREELEVILC